MRNIFLLALLWISVSIGNAQVIVDFENAATVPSLAPASAAVVANPLVNTTNSSSKVGYYKNEIGEWNYFTMTFATPIQVKKNNTLTFKVKAGASGRIFAKFWSGGNVLTEGWAPTYDFMPAPGKWVECKMTLAESAMDKTFDKLEIAALVDKDDVAADVYFDDFELSNPLLGDGSPHANLSLSALTINMGGSVTFDGSKSYDLDGTVASYSWNFEDGAISTDVKSTHVFATSGIYKVVLTVTDNEGKTNSKSIYVSVLDPSQKFSAFRVVSPTTETNKKIESIFQLTSVYTNVYNPDEVKVDAEITMPDASKLLVPCFYYEKPRVSGNSWAIDSTLSSWMLRFSTTQVGVHKIVLKLTDKNGTFSSSESTVDVKASTIPGIIKVDAANKQFYRRTTGESFFPLGINAGWSDIGTYTTILNNLGSGNANLVRYWHTGFANQALEWKKGGIYKGLGYYSQQAAGMSDSIIDLCEKNNLTLQLTLFQHGQVSETVDSNWGDNPLNIVNGGYVSQSEEFFYNADCKKNTQNKLRYIIARWGYSPNIFAWELFNEVNFSGNNPSQTVKWWPGVMQWHSEMSKYLKDNDPFHHITTTSVSGDDGKLTQMDTITSLDVLQYHMYNDNMLIVQSNNDSIFQSQLKNKGIINGEYGTNNLADVPFDVQRTAIWNSIMNRVPHFMWIWGHYTESEWSDLFSMPASFVKNIDFTKEAITPIKASAVNGLKNMLVSGFATKSAQYAYINDPSEGTNIQNAVLKITNLPVGVYTITYYLPVENTTKVVDDVALVAPVNKIVLPQFSNGIAVRIDFKAAYTLPVAIAGNDSIVAPGNTINFDGGRSYSQSGKALTYQWTLVSKPATSTMSLVNATSKNMDATFDVAGSYRIGLTVKDDAASAPHYVDVYVSNRPVAICGNDTVVALNKRVLLIGESSYDLDNDPLTYKWEIISAPANGAALFSTSTSRTRIQSAEEGTYLITLVVSDGYSESKADTIKVVYSLNTGIVANEMNNVKVYPNPTNQNVTVEFDEPTANGVSVELCDLTGKQIVKLDKQFAQTINLDLSKYSVAGGIYFLRITSGEKTKVQKIVYQK
jgi:hypothetical protein